MDDQLNNQIEERIKKLVPDLLKSSAFTDKKVTDTPTDNLQVVNKKYVDNLIPAIINGKMYLNASQSIGGTAEIVKLDTTSFANGITADTSNNQFVILT